MNNKIDQQSADNIRALAVAMVEKAKENQSFDRGFDQKTKENQGFGLTPWPIKVLGSVYTCPGYISLKEVTWACPGIRPGFWSKSKGKSRIWLFGGICKQKTISTNSRSTAHGGQLVYVSRLYILPYYSVLPHCILNNQRFGHNFWWFSPFETPLRWVCTIFRALSFEMGPGVWFFDFLR